MQAFPVFRVELVEETTGRSAHEVEVGESALEVGRECARRLGWVGADGNGGRVVLIFGPVASRRWLWGDVWREGRALWSAEDRSASVDADEVGFMTFLRLADPLLGSVAHRKTGVRYRAEPTLEWLVEAVRIMVARTAMGPPVLLLKYEREERENAREVLF